ncbi:RNA polymerase-binding protein RbpA [Streptomyces badius]
MTRRCRTPGTARAAASAGQDKDSPPDPPRTEPYKTHLAYVRERRSDEDGEAILAEALAKLRGEI